MLPLILYNPDQNLVAMHPNSLLSQSKSCRETSRCEEILPFLDKGKFHYMEKESNFFQ